MEQTGNHEALYFLKLVRECSVTGDSKYCYVALIFLKSYAKVTSDL